MVVVVGFKQTVAFEKRRFYNLLTKKAGRICNPERERRIERRGGREAWGERKRERETGRTLRGGGEEVVLLFN